MLPKELLKEVIDELDAYCEQHPEALSLTAFVNHMHIKHTAERPGTRRVGGNFAAAPDRDVPAEDLGKLLVMLNRYAKHYLKLAFAESPVQTPEEFTCLMVLFTHEQLLQAELIRANILEKATGNEVIKRLMRMGLIIEAPKVKDKRAKPISISQEGRQVILKLLPAMRLVGKVIAGNLSAAERQLLIHLLAKLDHYHHNLYDKKERFSLADYLG